MSSSVTPGVSRTPPSVTMPGAAAGEHARGEDVADRAGARLAAGFHDQHLARRDRLDDALLGVPSARASGRGRPRAARRSAACVRSRPCADPDGSDAGRSGTSSGDAALGELDGQRRRRHLAQRRLGVRRERAGAAGGRLRRSQTRAPRRWPSASRRGQPSGAGASTTVLRHASRRPPARPRSHRPAPPRWLRPACR